MKSIAKKKKVTLFSGILLSAVVFCLLFPQTVVAKSNQQAIIGVDSEDPGGYAKHPADDSRAAVVVCVASKYNSVTDAYNIRFGYSANSGVSWQGWEWVASSPNEQDYPDVRIYLENGDSIRIVAVWQERDDGNSPWTIKACSKYYSPPAGWGSVIDISDTEDENDNIYPKIDTMVSGSGGGSGYYHYWNIVWQRMNDDSEWEIKMYSSYYTTGNPTTFTNTIITDSENSYRHPAVACNWISGNTCEVHIVYDAHISSLHYVQVQSGWVNTNAVYTKYNTGPLNLAWNTQDTRIGYPDIVSTGPGGGSGHPNPLVQSGQADVWVVWHHEINDANKVQRAYSGNSLNSQPTNYTFNSNNGPSTSAVLRCVAVAMNEPSTSPISVVWTDDDDVYFSTSTDWNTVEQWTSTEEIDIHVDVSLSTPSATTYSHVVWQRDSQTIYYAQDP